MSEREVAWEQDEMIRRTVALPRTICEGMAAEAARRGLTVDELVAEYVAAGLRDAAKT